MVAVVVTTEIGTRIVMAGRQQGVAVDEVAEEEEVVVVVAVLITQMVEVVGLVGLPPTMVLAVAVAAAAAVVDTIKTAVAEVNATRRLAIHHLVRQAIRVVDRLLCAHRSSPWRRLSCWK
jgi:hypothetical protein